MSKSMCIPVNNQIWVHCLIACKCVEQNKIMATENILEESILKFIMLLDEGVTVLLSSFVSLI